MTGDSDYSVGPDESGVLSLVPSIQQQLESIKRVATTQLSVLILGESGTGKESMARAVHRLSGRTGRLVAVSCGAIARNLIESEFFGYRRGAFSGADEDRLGFIRAADGGTLFLDELADLPDAGQAALLRVLQERELLPVGATKPITVDVRVVAATHRELQGTVRPDLLARVRGVEIRMAPLRGRLGDIGLILATISARISATTGVRPSFTPAAIGAILAYDWPLNVRQLEQSIMARAAITGGRIEAKHVADQIAAAQEAAPPLPTPATPPQTERPMSEEDRMRRDHLIALFEQYSGNLSAVARALGKERLQIRRWIKRYGIDIGRTAS